MEYPLRVQKAEGPSWAHIRDAADAVIAGGILPEDAAALVDAYNAQHGGKKKSKKIQVEEALRRSDLTAQSVGREDIEYGHFDSLPRGEHVARLGKQGG